MEAAKLDGHGTILAVRSRICARVPRVREGRCWNGRSSHGRMGQVAQAGVLQGVARATTCPRAEIFSWPPVVTIACVGDLLLGYRRAGKGDVAAAAAGTALTCSATWAVAAFWPAAPLVVQPPWAAASASC